MRPSNFDASSSASQPGSQPAMRPRTGHTTHQCATRISSTGGDLQICRTPYGIAGRDSNGPSIRIFCKLDGPTSAADPSLEFNPKSLKHIISEKELEKHKHIFPGVTNGSPFGHKSGGHSREHVRNTQRNTQKKKISQRNKQK